VVSAIGLGAALLVGAATGVALQQRLAGTVVASLTVALISLVAWHTAQTTAIVRRGIARVTIGNGMVALASSSARVPLISPSLLRRYGLRSALIFVLTILTLGASTVDRRDSAQRTLSSRAGPVRSAGRGRGRGRRWRYPRWPSRPSCPPGPGRSRRGPRRRR